MSERHARSPLRAVVVALTLVAGTGVAHAQDQQPPFDLDWRAPAGCTSAERLSTEITRLIGPNAHPEGTTHVSGEVSAQDNGTYLVKLALEQSGRPGERTLTGATCAEVSRAAALLIALAIAPDAAHEEPEPRPKPPRPKPPPPPPPPPPPKPPPPPERRFALALGPAAEVGLLPNLGAGGELSLGAAFKRFSFEAFGATYLNQNRAAEAGSGGGRFSVRSFGVRGCAGLAPGDFSFAACVGGSTNHVAARGYGVDFPGSNSTDVGSLSLAVRVELHFSANVSLRLDAGPHYMLGGASFVLSSDTTTPVRPIPVYRITSFDAGGSLKLVWHF